MLARAGLFKTLFFPHIIDDEFIAAIVGHVTESIRSLDLSGLRRRKAQTLIEATACQAIAEMWTAAYGREYKPTRFWPNATAILIDKPRRCVLELWIGHDYHNSELPDPIEIALDGVHE